MMKQCLPIFQNSGEQEAECISPQLKAQLPGTGSKSSQGREKKESVQFS